MCCPYCPWSMLKLTVVSPLKTWAPTPARNNQLWTVTLKHPCHNFLKLFSMASCLDCFFVGGEDGENGGEVVTDSFYVPHSQLWVCSFHTIVKEASLPSSVSDSMDYELPHDFQQQHGPWTSAWPLEAAWTTDLSMVSSGCTDHENEHSPRPQHRLWSCYGPQQQHRSWKSTWPQRQHGPWTSIWSLAEAQAMDINTVLSHNMDSEMNDS